MVISNYSSFTSWI